MVLGNIFERYCFHGFYYEKEKGGQFIPVSEPARGHRPYYFSPPDPDLKSARSLPRLLTCLEPAAEFSHPEFRNVK